MDLIRRPPKRVLLIATLWLLIAALSTYAIAALNLTGAVYPLTAAVLLTAYYLILATRGCTEFTDDAVHNTLLRTATIPWDEVDRIHLVRSGRAAWLHLALDRRRIRLAAPRTGLLARDPAFDDHLAELKQAHDVTETRIPGWLPATAATVAVLLIAAAVAVLDRPWLSDWWPGVPAASAPVPCRVFDGPTLDQALTRHHDAGAPTTDFFGDGCQWRRLGDLGWDLVVSYDRFTRTARTTATAEAEDAFAVYAEDQRELGGIGDEAATRTRGAITSVLVRKVNVIVEIEYNGDPATAVQLARIASAAVTVE